MIDPETKEAYAWFRNLTIAESKHMIAQLWPDGTWSFAWDGTQPLVIREMYKHFKSQLPQSEVVNSAIEELKRLTGEDFHGYRSEVYRVIVCAIRGELSQIKSDKTEP